MKILTSVLMAMALILSEKVPSNTSVTVSEPITAERIEEALSLPKNSLNGITVTSLPQLEYGRLICEGIEIEAFDYIPRESLDWLVFESFSDKTSAFAVLPDSDIDISECMLSLGDDLSSETVVIRSDILAWKQAEDSYFSDDSMGY